LDYSQHKILVDVDGVLLDWTGAFETWLAETRDMHVQTDENVYELSQRYGITQERVDALIERFNSSAWIGFIKPFRDSVSILARFKGDNYHFEAITSSHDDYWASELRRRNLEHWFPSTIRRVRCLKTQAPKDKILKEYEGSGFWWVEDKPENCEAGLRAGLKPILMTHDFNVDYHHPEVVRAKDWTEIYEIITNGKQTIEI